MTIVSPPRQSTGLPDAFRIEIQPQGDRVLVVLHGELDIATAPGLDDEIDGLVERGFGELVIDLRRTSFIDSSGLHLLVRQAARPDAAISVIVGRPSMRRIFDIAGVLDVVRLEPTP